MSTSMSCYQIPIHKLTTGMSYECRFFLHQYTAYYNSVRNQNNYSVFHE